MRKYRDDYPGWLKYRWAVCFLYLWAYICVMVFHELPSQDWAISILFMPFAMLFVGIIVAAYSRMEKLKGKGAWPERNGYEADLIGISIFISFSLSVLFSIFLFFERATAFIGVSMIGILFSVILFISVEIALAQYTIKEQWWRPISRTILALFVPVVVVGVIDFGLWLVSFGGFIMALGIAIALTVIWAAISLIGSIMNS